MPDITKTNIRISGSASVSETTLDGTTDTFAFVAGRSALLVLRNPTAGALSPVIDGDGASTVQVSGAASFDISGGYSVGAIAAGAVQVVRLDSIAEYLKGTIAITGGAGLVAAILGAQ